MKWQNELIAYRNPKDGKPYTKSYLKAVHNQLGTVLNYAVKYYGLKKNVAAVVGNMGHEKDINMLFWTLDEYNRFSVAVKDYEIHYIAFKILYWCGIREGELLALTPDDFDFSAGTLSVNKIYYRSHGIDYVTPPKSNRTIVIPKKLSVEVE